ncbi:uncharacterized protein L203_103090 [Cryptococcus depauperatus CBS 7841]|uniref:Uncharacterized protein n=1 Tax=Cryptococcus depauperatus CBS 7841 TaxID=1295531 RepID=A0AAJ8JT15_9TREE
MVRSGIQQDVISLYRHGIQAMMNKPSESRPAFLLHLRYNFRNPSLKPREYIAIEHQLRKMSRMIEMLSDSSVQSISVSDEMKSWWTREVAKAQSRQSELEK